MRHGTSNRRTRSRNPNTNHNSNGGGRGKAPNKNKVFDSSGPEVRIRGTAHQITEKYAALAKDATSSGHHTLAESYMQHAEHYQRLLNEWAEQQPVQVTKPVANTEEVTSDDTSDVVAAAETQKEKVLEEA